MRIYTLAKIAQSLHLGMLAGIFATIGWPRFDCQTRGGYAAPGGLSQASVTSHVNSLLKSTPLWLIT